MSWSVVIFSNSYRYSLNFSFCSAVSPEVFFAFFAFLAELFGLEPERLPRDFLADFDFDLDLDLFTLFTY